MTDPPDQPHLTTAHDRWVARDAAVVWHGFTQMSCYGENQPVIVEAADGHELIDVDGNRYLDAISSLWVTTLGHNVPELDRALREQLDRVAHTTLLGNGNRATVELAEALAPRVPVPEPHFLFASDGAAAVEQALKIAFQYWTNQGVTDRTRYLALGGAYHGDTVGGISLSDGGFGTEVYDPLRFPVLRAPGYDDPGWADTTCALIAAHAHELAAVVIEPLVQGAAGMWVTDPQSVERVGDACREHGVLPRPGRPRARVGGCRTQRRRNPSPGSPRDPASPCGAVKRVRSSRRILHLTGAGARQSLGVRRNRQGRLRYGGRRLGQHPA